VGIRLEMQVSLNIQKAVKSNHQINKIKDNHSTCREILWQTLIPIHDKNLSTGAGRAAQVVRVPT
jgi:hypothetical protein